MGALKIKENKLTVVHEVSNADKINSAMALLMDAHNLLAKSKLNSDQYNPISYKLNQAKVLLSKLEHERI